jgi:hypothetical protein
MTREKKGLKGISKKMEGQVARMEPREIVKRYVGALPLGRRQA